MTKRSAHSTIYIKFTPSLVYGAPANVSARKTSKGIEITWSASLQPGITPYQVYRRLAAEKTAALIGSVDVRQLSYFDTKATAGQLYFYSLKVAAGNTVSEASIEKGVRY